MHESELVIIFTFVSFIVVASLIAWLISLKINQTSVKHSLIHDEGFMLALREYKEKTERRISTLEAEISDLKRNHRPETGSSAANSAEMTGDTSTGTPDAETATNTD